MAAAPLESAALQGAAPPEASYTIKWLLLHWRPLLYRGLHAPLEASSTIVWLLLLWNPLLYRGLLAGVQHICVAASPLESAALQGAARWRLPPKLCDFCSSGARCSTCMWLLRCRLPLQLSCCCSIGIRCFTVHAAAPLGASSTIMML